MAINFKEKYGLDINETERKASFGKTYKCIKNPILRAIRLKIWHKDVYSKDRLYRRGIIEDNLCDKCKQIEYVEHQLWGCAEVKKKWNVYNSLMDELNAPDCKIYTLKDIIFTRRQDTIISETI
jgi:hypothetical protein